MVHHILEPPKGVATPGEEPDCVFVLHMSAQNRESKDRAVCNLTTTLDTLQIEKLTTTHDDNNRGLKNSTSRATVVWYERVAKVPEKVDNTVTAK